MGSYDALAFHIIETAHRPSRRRSRPMSSGLGARIAAWFAKPRFEPRVRQPEPICCPAGA
jgi:hypothetical protein